MDILVNLSIGRLGAIQKRAEFVVAHARSGGEAWADGAPEFDVVVSLCQYVGNGGVVRGRTLGKYMYLGVGRGYLVLKDGSQWRIGSGEATLVQSSRDPHWLSTINPAFVEDRPVLIKRIDDYGAIAYITRCLEEI